MNPFATNPEQPSGTTPLGQQVQGGTLTNFLMMLAHELRAPLAPLLHGLRIIRLAPDPAMREQALELVERQVQHLGHLLDALLDSSRVATGHIELHRVPLDLTHLVRTVADDYRPMLSDAGLVLLLEVPDTPTWVLGDATRLVQVLGSLLDNAVRFRDGGRNVNVDLTADTGGNHAVLRVRDDGIGFDDQFVPRLWDLFSQADQGLPHSRGGLGLGLALVRSLVELHGGQVEATSAGPGRGAEFTVRLPLSSEPATSTRTPTPPLPDAKQLRILLIEDNHDSALALQMLLGLLGHEVAVAHSGPEGVSKALQWRPDLVISDIGLPGLDGWEVARVLRHHQATADVKLIALTGYGRDEDRRHAEEVGYNAFVTKPADPDLLQEVLARVDC
jgi:CheY-like chemotaxis protein